jgi:uncharacterized cupredoxin-like copper-binding protein
MKTRRLRAATICLAMLATAACAKAPAIQAEIDAQAAVAATPAGNPPVTSPRLVDHQIGISLAEFTLGASQASIPAGVYTFDIANTGQVQHELLVFRSDLAPSALPLVGGNLDEEGQGVNKISDGDNLDPGTVQTREVDLRQPGTYLLICNLPGHLHKGMIRTLIVTKAGS